MNLSAFIFSKDRRIVLARHTVFWLAWILYYCIPAYLNRMDRLAPSANAQLAVIELSAGTLIDMAYCYIIIYWLVPRFFFRGSFGAFFLLWVAHTVVFVFMFRIYNQHVLVHIRDLFDLPRQPPPALYRAFFWLFPSLGFEGCLAALIVLGKNWYVSNQNFLQLRAEKRTAARYHKIQNQSVILFPVLETCFEHLGSTKPVWAGSPNGQVQTQLGVNVLNLVKRVTANAQLRQITLAEERANLHDYLALQQGQGVSFATNDAPVDDSAELMPNFLLAVSALPLLDRETLQPGKTINTELHTTGGELLFNLQWQRTSTAGGLRPRQYDTLQHLKTILNFHYPRSNIFEVNISQDTVQLHLQLRLRERI